MALPADNSSWPPKPWDTAYKAYRENEAWYLGDVDGLTSLYRSSQQERPSHRVRGAEYTGGVVGLASRLFWGRPVPPDQNRTRLHIPAPADLASIASDMVFAVPPEVSLLTGNKAAQGRLDVIANSDAAHAMYSTMGELKSVFGATVIVSEWDTDIADNVWLSTYGVDIVIPEFRKGKLIACTMWTEIRDGSVFYRHLERHAIGSIEHALFAGSADKLGRRVPLQDRPETAHLAPLVNGDSMILTGIDRLTVSYNLNMPTRSWRKLGELAYAGRSDFAGGLIPLFDALDETWSSWMRDLKQGAGKIVLDQALLDTGPRGSGASFDIGQEAIVALNAPGNSNDRRQIDKIQFEIRVEQHEATANALRKEIFRAAGQGTRGIGADEGGDVTATGELLRDKREETTRDKKLLHDKRAIAEQASVALELDGRLFPGKGGGRYDLAVTFADVSQSDPEKDARTIGLLDAAGALSLYVKVQMAHPDWEDQQIKDEVKAIREEKAAAMPAALDPATFTGNDNPDPNPDEQEDDE